MHDPILKSPLHEFDLIYYKLLGEEINGQGSILHTRNTEQMLQISFNLS